MNKISFNGKNEVIYGLNKAAMAARAAENSRAASFGPRPQNLVHLEMTNKTTMNAYLDMITRDRSFVKTISDRNQKDMLSLSGILKPERFRYGNINPLKLFKTSISDACVNIKNQNKQTNIMNFLNKIETICKQL